MTLLSATAVAIQAQTPDEKVAQLQEQFGKLDALCERIDAASQRIGELISRGAQQ